MEFLVLNFKNQFSYVLPLSIYEDPTIPIGIIEDNIEEVDEFFEIEMITLGNLEVFKEYSPLIEVDSLESLLRKVNELM